MERRTAIVAAAATSLTLLAGAAAISLNTQLVDAGGDDGVGRVSPIATSSEPPGAPVQVDDPVGTPDDDRYEDDDRNEDDDRYEDRHDDEHEYEGADDDD
ncbi:MAG TPA: hypothetical protein VFP06_08700 [Acidimicrobiales bacterium]|nr:hypothetical protein [Acidimicrobiales bacterium]